MAIERREDDRRPDRDRRGHMSRRGSNEMFGLDVDSMSPTAQVATGAIVLGVTVVGLAAVLLLIPELWWLIFFFGWTVFPAFGLFLRGIAGVVDSDSSSGKPAPVSDRERELLEALSRKGEMTPAQAAMETSLTVKEADEMMKDLAKEGHLDVRVHGGGIFYALWDYDRDTSDGDAGTST